MAEDILVEVPDCRQVDGEPHRRWFANDTFDLIVWLADDSHMLGFQLCYRHGAEEHALTWRKGLGCCHHRVDDGEDSPAGPKMIPILVSDGRFDSNRAAKLFEAQSQAVEPQIREAVLQHLREYYES